MTELIYTLLILGGVLAGLRMYYDDQAYRNATTSRPKPAKPKSKPKPKTNKKKEDPNLKAAKATLVASGWTATEANKMLEGITASTPDEYVNQAMMKVKI